MVVEQDGRHRSIAQLSRAFHARLLEEENCAALIGATELTFSLTASTGEGITLFDGGAILPW